MSPRPPDDMAVLVERLTAAALEQARAAERLQAILERGVEHLGEVAEQLGELHRAARLGRLR
jgi:hypothetical protein